MEDDAERKRLRAQRRRTDKARQFPANTCPASRHLHLIADALAKGQPYPMLAEEPQHCALTMLSVLESLWTARTQIAGWEAANGKQS